MKSFFRILFMVNIIVGIFTLAGFSASLIRPSNIPFLQSIGLLMPWLLLITTFFSAFWIVLRDKRCWLSILILLMGISQITRFVGFHFNQYEDTDFFRFMSYNSQSYNRTNHISSFLQSEPEFKTCEIICLQELSDEYVPYLENELPHQHRHFFKGKIILSTFPMLARGKIQFDNSVNGCLWADIQFNNRKFRIYNIHLRSNQITRQAEMILDSIQLEKKHTWTRFRQMFTNYQKAAEIRVEQSRKILNHIKESPYPVILGGDFNDTPFSYTYHAFQNVLSDHFKKKGLGIGTTYAGALPGLKIDYIFADENFKVYGHKIIKTRISDHFPVISRVNLKN